MNFRKSSTGWLRLCLLAAVMAVLAVSCSTPLKEVTYMHGIEAGQTYPGTPSPDFYRVRPNDHLYIQVMGDDPLNTVFLNLNTGQNTAVSQNIELIAYTVDESGNISFPHLGDLSVGGKTVTEIRDMIQKEVDSYIEGTSVHVKLINRRITVLGEVRNPGQHPMINNHLTVFEALGTAGDITDFGERRSVKLIRETPAGRQVISLDLTDPGMVNSEYYYILPHDMIYVEPRNKVYGAKTFPFSSQYSLALSVISTIFLILNFMK